MLRALTSTDDGRLLWSQRFDRQLVNVFAIQDEIATTIVSTLRATMFAELSEHVPRRYTPNIRAYGLYLKGRYEWNKRTREGVAEAIRYFERAIAEGAYEERRGWVAYVNVNPMFDPLRGEPRFAALVRRMRL